MRIISRFGIAILLLIIFHPAGRPALAAQFGADRPVAGQSASNRMVAVRGGRLLDSKTGKVSANQVVLIRGERIEEVGPAEQVAIPAGAEVIDLSGATVLPGLIDAHTHLFLTGES